MFFTQEDYRKIENWLYQRAVKDTYFPTADSMDGTEKIPIIQNNKNKILNLNDFVKQVADMKLPDFYNVTAESKKSCLCLKEAIELVPVKQRKIGLTITFHSKKGNWVIFQFKGTSLNQWSSIDCWENIIWQAIEEFVFFPDEEDITGVRKDNRTYLKFKDKDYNPEEFSGMGRVILRKNLVATDACTIDDEDHYINELTQDMLNEENTVYIIQYDFDLNGKALTIPMGCTLWFQGGSINNGSLYLNETAILGAFEFADMGTAKLFGKFNKGQIMAFTNEEAKIKRGNFFKKGYNNSSTTEEEDSAQDLEVSYHINDAAYHTKTRQELRWYDGEAWNLILDINDYLEIKSIIYDLIDKHNAEMSACYKYFKKRCYAIEKNVADIQSSVTNIENHITNIENNITNIQNDITNLEEIINNLQEFISNIEETINNYIEQYITNNVIGTASVTVNGTKYTPDSNGNITLPDYPEPGGGTANSVTGKLKFTGASTATYNGSSDVTVNIPEAYDDTALAERVSALEAMTVRIEGTINLPAGQQTFQVDVQATNVNGEEQEVDYNVSADDNITLESDE